jgi:hypothetical protein
MFFIVNSDIYLGDARFGSWRECLLCWLMVFTVFLNALRQVPGEYCKLGHESFLPHPFQFVIH